MTFYEELAFEVYNQFGWFIKEYWVNFFFKGIFPMLIGIYLFHFIMSGKLVRLIISIKKNIFSDTSGKNKLLTNIKRQEMDEIRCPHCNESNEFELFEDLKTTFMVFKCIDCGQFTCSTLKKNNNYT